MERRSRPSLGVHFSRGRKLSLNHLVGNSFGVDSNVSKVVVLSRKKVRSTIERQVDYVDGIAGVQEVGRPSWGVVGFVEPNLWSCQYF